MNREPKRVREEVNIGCALIGVALTVFWTLCWSWWR